MSKKCGMPWMKLNRKTYRVGSKQAEHHGNNKAVMCEALKERWSKDCDLDRTKTKNNLYYGYDSGLLLLSDIDREIKELSEKLQKEGKRGVRADAITSFAGIVKPDTEIMEHLSEREKVQFFRDALEILHKKFGKNPNTQKPNLRAAVIQVDEGNWHMHYFGVPYTADGRLSAKEIFTPQFSRWLNEEFPRLMNEKATALEKQRLVKYQEIGVDYYNRAKNLYECLEKEDINFKKERAKRYDGSLQRLEALYPQLDETLMPHIHKKEKERQMGL